MTITYTTPWPEHPNVRIPVLYKIMYDHSVDGVDAQYQRSYKDHQVDEWLKANCRAPYYRSTYHRKKFIQFEDDADAMWFALRWA
jgi:hypothetical protein